MSLPGTLGGQSRESATRLRLRGSAGGWDSACPALSFWGPGKHVHPASPQEQGSLETHGKHAAASPAPKATSRQQHRELTVRRDATQGGHSQPDQRAPQHQDRPQGYVTAARRPTRAYWSAARLRRPSAQIASAGHYPPPPTGITSPSPAPPYSVLPSPLPSLVVTAVRPCAPAYERGRGEGAPHPRLTTPATPIVVASPSDSAFFHRLLFS